MELDCPLCSARLEFDVGDGGDFTCPACGGEFAVEVEKAVPDRIIPEHDVITPVPPRAHTVVDEALVDVEESGTAPLSQPSVQQSLRADSGLQADAQPGPEPTAAMASREHFEEPEQKPSAMAVFKRKENKIHLTIFAFYLLLFAGIGFVPDAKNAADGYLVTLLIAFAWGGTLAYVLLALGAKIIPPLEGLFGTWKRGMWTVVIVTVIMIILILTADVLLKEGTFEQEVTNSETGEVEQEPIVFEDLIVYLGWSLVGLFIVWHYTMAWSIRGPVEGFASGRMKKWTEARAKTNGNMAASGGYSKALISGIFFPLIVVALFSGALWAFNGGFQEVGAIEKEIDEETGEEIDPEIPMGMIIGYATTMMVVVVGGVLYLVHLRMLRPLSKHGDVTTFVAWFVPIYFIFIALQMFLGFNSLIQRSAATEGTRIVGLLIDIVLLGIGVLAAVYKFIKLALSGRSRLFTQNNAVLWGMAFGVPYLGAIFYVGILVGDPGLISIVSKGLISVFAFWLILKMCKQTIVNQGVTPRTSMKKLIWRQVQESDEATRRMARAVRDHMKTQDDGS